MSVAILSNVLGKEGADCLISEGEENNLVKKMLDCLEKVSDRSYELSCKKIYFVCKPWSKI